MEFLYRAQVFVYEIDIKIDCYQIFEFDDSVKIVVKIEENVINLVVAVKFEECLNAILISNIFTS